MTNIETLTTFFGWCIVINSGVLVISTLVLTLMQGVVTDIHSKLFGLEKAQLTTLYFSYLGHYKVAIFVLNIAPYAALKLMGY